MAPKPMVQDAKRLALIVDDDPTVQKTMADHLGQMDFEVLSALHYDSAVHLLAGRIPQLVCVDVGLPVQSGYELCEYIRGPLGLTKIPILVMSRSYFPDDQANAEEAGANAFLKKPFSKHQLTGCINALLADPNPSAGPNPSGEET